MRHGDVVPTKSLNVVLGADGRGSASFKPPKGKQFVLLLLGVEDTKDGGQKLDPVAALKALGWHPEREPPPDPPLPIPEHEGKDLDGSS